MKVDFGDSPAPGTPSFPPSVDNRPGLSRIQYGVGGYAEVRAALMTALDHNGALSKWTYRGPDDPGIALLESSSVLVDILSFYQGLYANEAYLRTAGWDASVRDLVRLTGYRLTPAVGGTGVFEFHVKGDAPVTIPLSFGLKLLMSGQKVPSTFETVSELKAYSSINDVRLYSGLDDAFDPQASSYSSFSLPTSELARAQVELKAGDRLLLKAGPGATVAAQVVTVQAVRTLLDRTVITIHGSWQKDATPESLVAFKLGPKSYRHWGYNAAPVWMKPNSPSGYTPETLDFTRLLGQDSSGQYDYVNPVIPAYVIPLEVDAKDVAAGQRVFVQGWGSVDMSVCGQLSSSEPVWLTVKAKVNSSFSGSQTFGALSGATLFVTLEPKTALSNYRWDIRNLLVHPVVGGKLSLRAAPVDVPFDGKTLWYFGSFANYQLLCGRSVALADDQGNFAQVNLMAPLAGSPEATAFSAPSDSSETGLFPLHTSAGLSSTFGTNSFASALPPSQTPVRVYGNAVVADEGQTEGPVVLGDGNGLLNFQSFKIPKSPLTYCSAASPVSPNGLQVWVSQRLWTWVPSLVTCGPKDEVFVTREDENGASWIQFGDGVTGARLPTGSQNVVCVYRHGAGSLGQGAPGATVKALQSLDGLGSVALVGRVSGGTQAELGTDAREAAPRKARDLGRLVSIGDYETEALSQPGVLKAKATFGSGVISVLVLMQDTTQGQFTDLVSGLTTPKHDASQAPGRYAVQYVQGGFQPVSIQATLVLDPTFESQVVQQAVLSALGADGVAGLFGVGQRDFGQHEYRNRIIAAIQSVPGVVGVQDVRTSTAGGQDDWDLVCAATSVLSLSSSDCQLTLVAANASGSSS